MKIFIYSLIIFTNILTNLFFSQQQLKPNEFVVGITYGNVSMFTNSTNTLKDVPYSCTGILTETNPTYLGYPTSPLNQLSTDGFNTIYLFQPAIWSESEYRMKTMIELVKNNNMKLVPFANGWFVPSTGIHDDNGANCFNNDLSIPPWNMTNSPGWNDPWNNCKARTNYDYLFNNIYNIPELKDVIWGHYLGGEHNFLHKYNYGTHCCENYDYYDREVPPDLLNHAINWFQIQAQPNQKVCLSIVNHGCSINNSTDDAEWNSSIGSYENYPIDHDPIEYLNLTNKPDVLFEESYTQFPKDTWWSYKYSNISNSGIGNNVHYLSKFKNIDYLKTLCKEVHSTITAERYINGQESNPNQYLAHYHTTNVLNANWLWFQAYTSIIHGVDGLWIYAHDSYTFEESQAGGNKEIQNDAGATHQIDRFSFNYFSQHYKEFIRHLSRELAYLQKNNFINSDKNSIIYSKTDHLDENCIVPEVINYMPIFFPKGYGPMPSSSKTLMTSDLLNEAYGLRYTIRTNGNETIMIITNPLNIPITTTLNFNELGNPVIQNSTGVKLLFENTFPSFDVVKSSAYKTNRNSNINLDNLTDEPENVLINFTNTTDKSFQISFGPMDTHIIKFVNDPIVHNNNGWTNVWSNFGSGKIDGHTIEDTDLFYIGDFDGDGTDELMCVSYNPNSQNDWITILKYINNDWEWIWSNYGNPSNGNGIYPYRSNFIIGDFDGDGKDEILGNDLNGWTTLFKFKNGTWQWVWSDNGNTSHALHPYKDKFYVGDFDGDGKEEILGCDLPSGWTTTFQWSGKDFIWAWSDYGNYHSIRDYRTNMIASDFDGDNKTELLGIDNWATVFNFDNGNWLWGWSTYGVNTFNGWTYPLPATDQLLAGNLDFDKKDELFFIQTNDNASWATSMDLKNDQSNWNWNWSANPIDCIPFIDDWSLNSQGGTNTKYYFLNASVNEPNYLLAMRKHCNTYLVNMYEPNNQNKNNNEAELILNINSEIVGINIFPNPSNGSFQIVSEITKITNVEIQDINGQVVHFESFDPVNRLFINISNYSVGIYFVKVSTINNEIAMRKVVIYN